MSFRVLCISRTLAAGGESIGRAVAERLGFRYVDEQIITRAAQIAQVDAALVAAAEHRQPLLQRLLDKLSAAASLVGPVTLATGVPIDVFVSPVTGYHADPEDLRVLIRAAIHEVAKAGQVVIVAHAASMALSGSEGVLRVLVTASPETRARRLAAAQQLGLNEATAAIDVSDRERHDYFRRFYKVEDELPTHYDVIINTDVLSPEQSLAIILCAVQGCAT